MLFRSLELSSEEEESIDALQRRLKLLELFKDQAELLAPMASRPSMFARPFRMRRRVLFSPDKSQMTHRNLFVAIQNIEAFAEESEKELPEVRVRTAAIHINDVIQDLGKRIRSAVQVSFRAFSKAPVENATTKEHKVYAIVGFLAMLEMVRNGVVAAEQGGTFHDIMMTSQTPSS